MTVFVLSHNLQINSPLAPAITANDLAKGLMRSSTEFTSSDPLEHPHWLVKLESNLTVNDMATELLRAWKTFRLSQGQSVDHTFLAVGGRKDSAALPNSPLQIGYWGVDFVECADRDGFLQSINWDALKSARKADAVFEIYV